ncbi:MAG TPA: YdcF family protein, partial [Clostridia bacterium]|nr:YdcF family protein [Clostridia bacterium]
EQLKTNRDCTRRRRVFRKILGAFLIILLILLVSAFFFPQQVLCVDSGDVRADVIVILGGQADERAPRAAELFLAGAAPKLLISGAGDAEENKHQLLRKGVPPTAILLETNSASTRQNAQFSIPLLRAQGVRKAILVTSWYHSRRGLECFRHYSSEIQFYSRPSYFAFNRPDWTRLGIRKCLRAEYVKLAGYWVCYGICPF